MSGIAWPWPWRRDATARMDNLENRVTASHVAAHRTRAESARLRRESEELTEQLRDRLARNGFADAIEALWRGKKT